MKKQEDQEGHNKIWSSWSPWSPCSNRILETLEWYWVSEQNETSKSTLKRAKLILKTRSVKKNNQWYVTLDDI